MYGVYLLCVTLSHRFYASLVVSAHVRYWSVSRPKGHSQVSPSCDHILVQAAMMLWSLIAEIGIYYGSLDVCLRLDKPLLASLLSGEADKFQSNAP